MTASSLLNNVISHSVRNCSLEKMQSKQSKRLWRPLSFKYKENTWMFWFRHSSKFKHLPWILYISKHFSNLDIHLLKSILNIWTLNSMNKAGFRYNTLVLKPAPPCSHWPPSPISPAWSWSWSTIEEEENMLEFVVTSRMCCHETFVWNLEINGSLVGVSGYDWSYWLRW